MGPGARTPDELETLLEDAFVTRDPEAVAQLFEEGAVLLADGVEEARGVEKIARFTTTMWESERTYVAEPQRVLQARNTALVVSDRGINVMRRGSDGAWRFAISIVSLEGRAGNAIADGYGRLVKRRRRRTGEGRAS